MNGILSRLLTRNHLIKTSANVIDGRDKFARRMADNNLRKAYRGNFERDE